MSEHHEEMSVQAVELCRDFNRRMASRQAENGIPLPEIAIGAIYSAVDVATEFNGNISDAIGWARNALDHMEMTLRANDNEPGRSIP